MIVEIVGSPFLERAIAYRNKSTFSHGKILEFCKEIGAESYFGIPGRTPTWFTFKGKVPPNWTRPNYTTGASRPFKTNLEARKLIEALPTLPTTDLVWCGEIPYSLSCKGKHIDVSSLLTPHYTREVGWTLSEVDATYFGVIPDVRSFATSELANLVSEGIDPSEVTCKLDNVDTNPFEWEVPEGLKVVSEAEKDLAYAVAKVAKEKSAKAFSVNN